MNALRNNKSLTELEVSCTYYYIVLYCIFTIFTILLGDNAYELNRIDAILLRNMDKINKRSTDELPLGLSSSSESESSSSSESESESESEIEETDMDIETDSDLDSDSDSKVNEEEKENKNEISEAESETDSIKNEDSVLFESQIKVSKDPVDYKEIVINQREIRVAFEYPLIKTVVLKLKSKTSKGFRRWDITKLLIKKYRWLFRKKHFIDGHDLNDVVITSLNYYSNENVWKPVIKNPTY